MKTLFPTVVFAYNRLAHLQKTIASLLECEESKETDLYIFSDGFRDSYDQDQVERVRHYLAQVSGFKSVIIENRNENFGLSKNVINGVNLVLSKHDAAIVVEDDIVVSADFLRVMNDLLIKYRDNDSVGSVSGFTYPIRIPEDVDDFFLLPRPSSWGWGTWADNWLNVDWEIQDFQRFKEIKSIQKEFNQGGEDLTPMLFKWRLGANDSWAVRWVYYHFREGLYSVFPRYNLVSNIGNDGSGTHSPSTSKYRNRLSENIHYITPDHLRVDDRLLIELKRFFKLSFVRRLINVITFKYHDCFDRLR